jgi:hypothetical protein
MKKRILMISGIGMAILLLGGAAYVGGHLLNGQALPWGGLNLLSRNGPREVHISRDDIQPAKEMPETRADVWGVFDHRQNNSIFIGTGQVEVSIQKDDRSGEVETSSNYDGPLVEVVVTPQTTIYVDVTLRQYNGEPPEGQSIQQVVEPGSLDDIGLSSTMGVWGKKTGDRIIADILVYETPAFVGK